MVLSLTVVDRGDGTGVDLTVAGSLGAVVDFYRLPVTGSVGTAAWQGFGQRVGDGALVANAAPGLFLWYAATAAAVSPVVTEAVRDLTAAVYDRVLDAVVARAALVNLEGIAGVSRDREPPADGVLTFPWLSVSAFEMTGEEQRGTQTTDYVWYPVELALLDNRAHEVDDGQMYLWRERLGRAFRRSVGVGGVVPEVITCRVEPGLTREQVPDAESLRERSVLVLWFLADEPRGIVAA